MFGGIFDWDNALAHLDSLNAEAEDPALWDDQARAQRILRDRTRLEKSIEEVRGLAQELEDLSLIHI